MFKYLIIVRPLGCLYGSAGAFLSPENLVGRSGEKFPPNAATLSGLFFNVKLAKNNLTEKQKEEIHTDLCANLYIAGPFWAEEENKHDFYVPIPWHRIIGENNQKDEWRLDKNGNWQREKPQIEPAFRWQRISQWKDKQPKCKSQPWSHVSFLHPHMKQEERHSQAKDGLFLENAVQIPEDICLVYLSTHELDDGWYRFGGENHIVEIECQEIDRTSKIWKLFQDPIKQAFALITPAIWSSTRFSYRFPQHPEFASYFPEDKTKLLTDKAIPYRTNTAGRLGRGCYAVPAGSVYVLPKPLNKAWIDLDENWFPNHGYSFKKIGCGLCLPIEIKGLKQYQEA